MFHSVSASSSFVISHCLSIANSVPGSSFLCNGTTVTSVLSKVFLFILTWLPFPPTTSKPFLLNSFTNSLPEIIGSFIAISSSAYRNRADSGFLYRGILKHFLDILVLQIKFNRFLEVLQSLAFCTPLTCNTKLWAQGNKSNISLCHNSRKFPIHLITK